jgi:hypothetical protein
MSAEKRGSVRCWSYMLFRFPGVYQVTAMFRRIFQRPQREPEPSAVERAERMISFQEAVVSLAFTLEERSLALRRQKTEPYISITIDGAFVSVPKEPPLS